MKLPRLYARLCAYQKCRLPFTDDRKYVFCSAECGRLSRGRDKYGRILQWWRPEYRRSA